jgi:hypothetical protein
VLDEAEEAERNGDDIPLALDGLTSSTHVNGEAENDDDVEEGEIEDGEVQDEEVDDAVESDGILRYPYGTREEKS